MVLPADLQAGRCRAVLSWLPSSRSPGLQDVPEEGSGQARGPPNAHARGTRRETGVRGVLEQDGAGRGSPGQGVGAVVWLLGLVTAVPVVSAFPREVSWWPSPPTLHWSWVCVSFSCRFNCEVSDPRDPAQKQVLSPETWVGSRAGGTRVVGWWVDSLLTSSWVLHSGAVTLGISIWGLLWVTPPAPLPSTVL